MPSEPAIKEPTFTGFVDSTYDALLLFEACLRQRVRKITRRLHEKERHLVTSGSVFVFDERESGIKRWTDNLFWSPSRILGNFLIYRELDKKDGNANSNASAPEANADEATPAMLGNSDPSLRGGDPSTAISRERSLLGSLTSSYKFKANGLVKKTISVSGMHMICYYRVNDVVSGRLRHPSSLPEIAALDISSSLLTNQNFRVPPKVEIGPDGKTRYAGELEEGGSSGQSSLLVPSGGSRRRSSSAERSVPARFTLPMEAPPSAEDSVPRPSIPVRPSLPRSSSNSSAKRFEPYARSSNEQQSTGHAYSLPINLQETSARRRSSPSWSPAHISVDLPGTSLPPSVPSPAGSSSSGGGGAYEAPYSHFNPNLAQPNRPQYYEDPLTAFRQYQAGHPQLNKAAQYRQGPPISVFPLPAESYRPYYSQPRSPQVYAQELPQEPPAPQEEIQYASALRRGSYDIADVASTGTVSSPTYAPLHYGYQQVVSPTGHQLPLPYASENPYTDFGHPAQYHPTGLVMPSPDQQGFPSPNLDQPPTNFADWHAQHGPMP